MDGGDDRARLTLTYTAHLSEQWNVYGPGAVGVGWELGLMGLATHLAQPTEPLLNEAAFAAAPAGKAFIAGSSERWAQVAVEAGAALVDARAAARHTTVTFPPRVIPPSMRGSGPCPA